MLTNPQLRAQVDQLWDKLWSGGLSNPLDAIEQLSYLLFLKRLDDEENARQRQATRRNESYTPRVPAELRWGAWTKLPAADALKHLKDAVFPKLKDLGAAGSSFGEYMRNAECKINKPSLLVEACALIDQMQIAAQNQDVQGDLYEYLLSKLSTAGRNGQFRTPRHIIRLLVQMVDPQPGERVGDLAAGTGGFLVNAFQHMLERHTSREVLRYDADGWPHNLVGDRLSDAQREAMQNGTIRGFDNDSGMTMLRIGSMNLLLHGIESPQFFYRDTLSKAYDEPRAFDVILMNPPFKGAVDKNDIHPDLAGAGTTKSELLFLHRILRSLDSGGRCAVIVPDGVLFGGSKAHVDTRRKLIEGNRLEGVVSMPGGVFKPYAGVSTAVLLFTKGAKTERIWYYDMEHDGFSLDDKRLPVADNDIPDIRACWEQRHDAAFEAARRERLQSLQAEIAPLKSERLRLQAGLDAVQFERAIAPEGDTEASAAYERESAQLATLNARIAPLQAQINQLTRQFWVSKAQVAANKYDLSASRYRQLERDEAYYPPPEVALERLRQLERAMDEEMRELDMMMP